MLLMLGLSLKRESSIHKVASLPIDRDVGGINKTYATSKQVQPLAIATMIGD